MTSRVTAILFLLHIGLRIIIENRFTIIQGCQRHLEMFFLPDVVVNI